MRDSILQKYTGRKIDDLVENGQVSDGQAAADHGAFGHLRGLRDRAVMLELRKKDGRIMAVSYGYLERAEYEPSEGITLTFAGQKIQIKGRNLNAEVRPTVRLFQGITRHRVAWVQEASTRDSIDATENATIVELIEW